MYVINLISCTTLLSSIFHPEMHLRHLTETTNELQIYYNLYSFLNAMI